ncbi:condensation domain-containing protein, partial [Clostridium botulinum]|uniref:condensation domain-containing protein n=1 Tax=Clostridium botulinum TaxID=1491 RepID=UPI000AF12AD3
AYNNISKFDLTLSAIELEEEILLSIKYSTTLFKIETIKKIAIHYKNIINEISLNPNTKINMFNILSKEESLKLRNFVDKTINKDLKVEFEF